MAPRLAARTSATPRLADFYSAPVAWFCSAVDIAAHLEKHAPARQVVVADHRRRRRDPLGGDGHQLPQPGRRGLGDPIRSSLRGRSGFIPWRGQSSGLEEHHPIVVVVAHLGVCGNAVGDRALADTRQSLRLAGGFSRILAADWRLGVEPPPPPCDIDLRDIDGFAGHCSASSTDAGLERLREEVRCPTTYKRTKAAIDEALPPRKRAARVASSGPDPGAGVYPGRRRPPRSAVAGSRTPRPPTTNFATLRRSGRCLSRVGSTPRAWTRCRT